MSFAIPQSIKTESYQVLAQPGLYMPATAAHLISSSEIYSGYAPASQFMTPPRPESRNTLGSSPRTRPDSRRDRSTEAPQAQRAASAQAKPRMQRDTSQSTPPKVKDSPASDNEVDQSTQDNERSASRPKRVRTGCLTCRERHLKCDEAMPICMNCKKSSRTCKRGVRLNFIDTRCEQPPHLVPARHDWKVSFEDNSREIASEYKGGFEKYANLEPERKKRRLTPPPDNGYQYASINAPVMQPQQLPQQSYSQYPDNVSLYSGSTTAQSYEDPGALLAQTYNARSSYDQSMMMHQEPQEPPPEVPGSPLTEPNEVLYMQVFVEEVGQWMDSMDEDKHFSRLLPIQSLKEPMLKYAILACGVRHLTLVNPATYQDEHALTYYAESNKLLLKSLQNPNRDTVLCATTATVLNVYEVMSETALQRMNHIAGARALIKECRWDGSATGIGAACFWLNVGLELFSCLHFNWGIAWDPDTWNIDMAMSPQAHGGNEVDWAHRILWILAKVTNFRSSTPRFQESSVYAEQTRQHARLQTWIGLKQFCDRWDKCVPPTMHPMAVVSEYAAHSKSAFPEIWYIKRAVIVARLFWHTALALLSCVHPMADASTNPSLVEEMTATRLYHSRQICGIVKHSKDRGIASASIRCLAVAAEWLTQRKEQEEVLVIFEEIKKQAGWRVSFINDELKDKWGWNSQGSAMDQYGNILPAQSGSAFFNQQGQAAMPAPLPQAAAPRKPPGGITNPLYKFADFSSQNPPYAGNYVPPAPGYLQHQTQELIGHGVHGHHQGSHRHQNHQHGNGQGLYPGYGQMAMQ